VKRSGTAGIDPDTFDSPEGASERVELGCDLASGIGSDAPAGA